MNLGKVEKLFTDLTASTSWFKVCWDGLRCVAYLLIPKRNLPQFCHTHNAQKCTFVIRKAKQRNSNQMILLEKMVPIIGVEPTTFALRIRCSTN